MYHKDQSKKINEKEIKEKIVKINKTKLGFFEKLNKIDKQLARLIKKKKGGRIFKSIKLEMKKGGQNRKHRKTRDDNRIL